MSVFQVPPQYGQVRLTGQSGGRNLLSNLASPQKTDRSVGRTGNVQLPGALLAMRSREEAL